MSRTASRLRRTAALVAIACGLAAVGAPVAQAHRILTFAGFSSPSSVAVSPSGDTVYVTNSDPFGVQSVGTITVSRDGVRLVLDASPTAIATAPNTPKGVAFTPDGTRALVTFGDGRLRSIDVPSGTLIGAAIEVAPSPATANPLGVAVSPDGRYAYTANLGIAGVSSPTIGIIDLAAGSRVAAPMATVASADVAVSPDGARVYMAPEGAGGFGYATWLDAADRISQVLIIAPTVDDEIRDSRGVAVSPDGSRAYFANGATGRILVADTALNQVVARIDLAGGSRPIGLAANRAGTRLYSVDQLTDTVSVVSLPDGVVRAQIALSAGSGPVAIALSPDDSMAYVAGGTTGTVMAVQLTPFAPVALSATTSDTTATVSFTAPEANGTPITGYEYSLNGGAWSATTAATTASPLVVTGLTPGTAYAIRTRAVDNRGAGVASAPVMVTTQSPAAATSAPRGSGITATKPRVLTASDGSVTLRTTVTTPGPGRIVQTATSPAGRTKALTRCTARATVKKAGEHVVTCRLNAKARAALRTARLVLAVTTTFTATGATTGSSTTDRVVVPRRR